jgi:hypothetical protein
MLDEIPLATLESYTVDNYVLFLQNHACDSDIDANQADFATIIANHIIKEKLNRYHKESMVPPKLGDVWELRIYVTIGKITWPIILDRGSSVSVISKSLSDYLDLSLIEKCDIDLKLSDFSSCGLDELISYGKSLSQSRHQL